MKASVIVPLNIRTGSPEILPNNNPGDKFYMPGDIIDIAEVVTGNMIKEIDFWYRLTDNTFVWSGGVTGTGLPTRKIDYKNAITNIPKEWLTNNGRNVKMAVLDTGFFLDHPDLKHLQSKAFIKDFGDNGNVTDMKGHGTHILGLLAAKTTFINGVNGLVNEADFFLYKVIMDGVGFLDSFAEAAVLDAIEKNVDVINMSFNVPSAIDSGLHKAIKKAQEKNILVISAAGENDNLNHELVFPAQYNGVISVGETSADFAHAGTISFNDQLDFILPFIEQTSCWIGAEKPYEKLKGSSMATALVSGILAAVLSSKGKNINALDELKNTVATFNANSFDDNNLKIIKP